MQTRCNVFILARRAQSGEGSLPRLWYLNFNADLYFSIYIYIYFSLSLSLVLETLANNRRISLVCVSRCLLLGEDIDPPSSVFVILCRYTYKCRNHDRLDWSNLQDWIFENWIRLLSIDWNDWSSRILKRIGGTESRRWIGLEKLEKSRYEMDYSFEIRYSVFVIL